MSEPTPESEVMSEHDEGHNAALDLAMRIVESVYSRVTDQTRQSKSDALWDMRPSRESFVAGLRRAAEITRMAPVHETEKIANVIEREAARVEGK